MNLAAGDGDFAAVAAVISASDGRAVAHAAAGVRGINRAAGYGDFAAVAALAAADARSVAGVYVNGAAGDGDFAAVAVAAAADAGALGLAFVVARDCAAGYGDFAAVAVVTAADARAVPAPGGDGAAVDRDGAAFAHVAAADARAPDAVGGDDAAVDGDLPRRPGLLAADGRGLMVVAARGSTGDKRAGAQGRFRRAGNGMDSALAPDRQRTAGRDGDAGVCREDLAVAEDDMHVAGDLDAPRNRRIRRDGVPAVRHRGGGVRHHGAGRGVHARAVLVHIGHNRGAGGKERACRDGGKQESLHCSFHSWRSPLEVVSMVFFTRSCFHRLFAPRWILLKTNPQVFSYFFDLHTLFSFVDFAHFAWDIPHFSFAFSLKKRFVLPVSSITVFPDALRE